MRKVDSNLVAPVDGRQIDGRDARLVVAGTRDGLHRRFGGRERPLLDVAVTVVAPVARLHRPPTNVVESLRLQPRPSYVADGLLLDVLPARAPVSTGNPQHVFCPGA